MNKNRWIIWFSITCLVGLLLVFIPSQIDRSYFQGFIDKIPPNTTFSSSDLLLYFGSLLTFIGTTILGISSLIQNDRLHSQNIQIEKNNTRIQLLLAQKDIPLITIEDFDLSGPTEKSEDWFHKKTNCIDSSKDEYERETYLINIYKYKNEISPKYLLRASFSFKNFGYGIIKTIEVLSITLDEIVLQNDKNEVFVQKEINIEAGSKINALLTNGDERFFKLNIIADSDIQKIYNGLFRASFKIKTTIVTGLEFIEIITLMTKSGIVLPIDYSIKPQEMIL